MSCMKKLAPHAMDRTVFLQKENSKNTNEKTIVRSAGDGRRRKEYGKEIRKSDC